MKTLQRELIESYIAYPEERFLSAFLLKHFGGWMFEEMDLPFEL